MCIYVCALVYECVLALVCRCMYGPEFYVGCLPLLFSTFLRGTLLLNLELTDLQEYLARWELPASTFPVQGLQVANRFFRSMLNFQAWSILAYVLCISEEWYEWQLGQISDCKAYIFHSLSSFLSNCSIIYKQNMKLLFVMED